MQSIKVKKLTIGSTLGIFSPSEPIIDTRVERFKNGISILESNGYHVKLATNALDRKYFMAGTVEERVSDINELLNDQTVNALIASWGGKSCNQLNKFIDYSLIKEKQKALIGFSDTGVLLNNVTAKTGLITFYGPNVIGKLDETSHSDLRLLREEMFSGNILGNVNNVECKVLKSGKAEGKLIGGNLSTFVLGVACSNIDESYYDGAILFWEDSSNTAQIISQYLSALLNKGIFDKIKGMVIGDFVTEEPVKWKRYNDFESILETLTEYDFPILYAPTFGHKKLENPIIPIGANCRLETDNFSIKLLEALTE